MSEPPRGEIILYEQEGGGPAIEVTLEEETLRLSQRQLAQLVSNLTYQHRLAHPEHLFRG